MIIAVDADGICCALHDEWLRRYNRDYNDTMTLDRWLGWGVEQYVKPECGLKIYDYLLQPDLYDDVKPIIGAKDGVDILRTMGHELIFVTACTYGMIDQKARWFERHGFVTPGKNGALPKEFAAVQDKNKIDAHLLIDDGAHNLRAWVEGKSRRAVMLEYPFNRFLLDEVPSQFWNWCYRATGWPAIVRHVASLDKRPT